jgi:hypothetical protein
MGKHAPKPRAGRSWSILAPTRKRARLMRAIDKTRPSNYPDPEIERWAAPVRVAILIAAAAACWAAIFYLLR